MRTIDFGSNILIHVIVFKKETFTDDIFTDDIFSGYKAKGLYGQFLQNNQNLF
jgi:hypothetical protein